MSDFPETQLRTPPSAPDLSVTRPYRVLIVEDNPGDARLLREYLAHAAIARFDIKIASRLDEAISSLRAREKETAFDIVLLDLTLPDAHGLETFSALTRAVPEVPVVVLSGLDDNVLAVRAVQNGAQDYLVKGQVNDAALARALVFAIERYRMHTQLKALSIIDDLTGLHNRRGFWTLAPQQMKNAARERHEMALYYADLDGLKQINDTFGHQHGDWALSQAAQALRSTFRASDIIARMGGDEFTVLAMPLSDDDISGGIERLHLNIAALNTNSKRPFTVKISIGAVTFDPSQLQNLDELLARADKALYRAKNEKRSAPLEIS